LEKRARKESSRIGVMVGKSRGREEESEREKKGVLFKMKDKKIP